MAVRSSGFSLLLGERLTKRQTCGIAIGALSAMLINWQ
jgi:drug/metabolite transporter (DMT)-like permease